MRHKPIAIAAAVLTGGLAAAGRWAVGNVEGAPKAVDLLGSLIDSALYLLSTTATVGGTTLALMLTVVGVARRADQQFEHALYRQVTHIASLSALGLALSLLLLLAMSIPFGAFEKIPEGAYGWIYEALYAGTALVVVLAVGTVTLLALTIRQLITRVAPDVEDGSD